MSNNEPDYDTLGAVTDGIDAAREAISAANSDVAAFGTGLKLTFVARTFAIVFLKKPQIYMLRVLQTEMSTGSKYFL